MPRFFQDEKIIKRNKHGKNKPFLEIAEVGETLSSRATGQLKWIDLDASYGNQKVSGERWGSGCLISENLFLTAGHCFDIACGITPYNPKKPWQPLQSKRFAKLMEVTFTYQLPANVPSGEIKDTELYYRGKKLIEYRTNGLDFAILELEGEPGKKFGIVKLSIEKIPNHILLSIIQHPDGKPKCMDYGNFLGYGKNCSKIKYALNTEGGSSGSPVFLHSSDEPQLFGIHTNGYDSYNFGISMRAIYRHSPVIQKTHCEHVSVIEDTYNLYASYWRNGKPKSQKPIAQLFRESIENYDEESADALVNEVMGVTFGALTTLFNPPVDISRNDRIAQNQKRISREDDESTCRLM